MRNIFMYAILFLACVPAAAMAQSATAEIEKVWVDHDTYHNGDKGMMIHVKFTVDNMLNKQGYCNAWFFFSDGTELKDNNSRYNTRSGYVATSESYTPSYQSSRYDDFKLFMPTSELHLAQGEHQLKFYVGIIDNNSNEIADSDWYYFSCTMGSGGNTPSPAPTPTPAPEKKEGKTWTKTRNNPDGSYTITTSLECGGCFGSGYSTCFNCMGTGQKAIYGYPIYYITCPMCSGVGKKMCTICGGAGQTFSQGTYWPDAAPVTPTTPYGGSIQSNPISSGSSVGTGSSSKVCSGCGGSGSCGVCYGGKYRICGGCGGSGVGSAGSCGGCNGAGKNICSGCRGSGNCGVCRGSGKINY